MLFILGFIFSGLLGYIGFREKALTKSGVVGAIITGTVIFGFGQYASWYMLLIIFFTSSSLLSFYRKKDKKEVENTFEKTGRRDLWQALANGGWASILAILGYFLGNEWIYVAFAATFATVNADTWATEIGILSKGKPRFILNGKLVEKGTSGGISLLGFFGSAAGSFFIAIISVVIIWLENHDLKIPIVSFVLIVGFSGVIGALVDSLFGATIQKMYKCSVCGKETEKIIHCGYKAIHIKGLSWMNNDMVNFISSVIGSLVAVMLSLGK